MQFISGTGIFVNCFIQLAVFLGLFLILGNKRHGVTARLIAVFIVTCYVVFLGIYAFATDGFFIVSPYISVRSPDDVTPLPSFSFLSLFFTLFSTFAVTLSLRLPCLFVCPFCFPHFLSRGNDRTQHTTTTDAAISTRRPSPAS